MPRSRGSDGAAVPPHHRASPRAPLHLRSTTNNNTATSADSNGTRPIRDRSPKLEEHRRSPRSPLPEVGVTTAQKKRATRVVDLETRLGHAQDELRKLREQLASADAAKKDAQHELQETKKKKKKGTCTASAGSPASKNHNAQSDQNGNCAVTPAGTPEKKKKKKKPELGEDNNNNKEHQDLRQEEKVDGRQSKVAEEKGEQPTAAPPVAEEVGCATDDDTQGEEGVKELAAVDDTVTASHVTTTADNIPLKEEEEPVVVKALDEEEVLVVKHEDDVEEQTNSVALEGDEHAMAATTTTQATATEEKEQEQVISPQSPDLTKKQQPTSPAPEEEMLELETRLWKKDKELDLLRSDNASLKSQLAESAAQISSFTIKVSSLESTLEEQRLAAEARLGEVESARATLEAEVKRLRVQTDQWRKAADAAAAIISGDANTTGTLGGRRVAERCGSMDKYIGGGFDAAAVLGSPLLDQSEGDGAVAGKRRGMRMFGDLWKKKGTSAGGGTSK